MINVVLYIILALFGIAISIALYRIIKGPSLPDRVAAMDMISVNLISAIAVISVIFRTTAFLEVILVIGILSFISTIALTRYIERGVIIERRRDD